MNPSVGASSRPESYAASNATPVIRGHYYVKPAFRSEFLMGWSMALLIAATLSPVIAAPQASPPKQSPTPGTPARPPIAPGTIRPGATDSQVLQLPQTTEFESGGLKYKAQTISGLTVMVALLPTRILGYVIIQASISNASGEIWNARSENFRFERGDPAVQGSEQPGAPSATSPAVVIRALSADAVVKDVFGRAGGGDVGRLITVYEAALYSNARAHSTNGYEARRKYAMGIGNTRLRAASAAAAIVMGAHNLNPGESTDGAVFLPNSGRHLGVGRLLFEMGNEVFRFAFDQSDVAVR